MAGIALIPTDWDVGQGVTATPRRFLTVRSAGGRRDRQPDCSRRHAEASLAESGRLAGSQTPSARSGR